MRSPWADHRGRAAGKSPKVIWMGSPVPRCLIQTCGVPPASLTNATVRPSGERVGHRCDPANVEISSRPPPARPPRSRRPGTAWRQVRNCPDEHGRGHQGDSDNHAGGLRRDSLVRLLPGPACTLRARTRRRVRSCRRIRSRGPCAAGDGLAGPLPFPSDEGSDAALQVGGDLLPGIKPFPGGTHRVQAGGGRSRVHGGSEVHHHCNPSRPRNGAIADARRDKVCQGRDGSLCLLRVSSPLLGSSPASSVRLLTARP